MFKSLLLRQVRPRLNPKFNRGLTTQKPPRVCGGFCLAEKERFDRATGSGARVNEPKTVRRTVFGEAKAPKQGAFRAVIYGGDGRRLATRRALACLHAEIISPSDQSALNSPSLRCGRIANSVGSPSEKAVLYPRVRRDNESSDRLRARQISPSPLTVTLFPAYVRTRTFAGRSRFPYFILGRTNLTSQKIATYESSWKSTQCRN